MAGGLDNTMIANILGALTPTGAAGIRARSRRSRRRR